MALSWLLLLLPLPGKVEQNGAINPWVQMKVWREPCAPSPEPWLLALSPGQHSHPNEITTSLETMSWEDGERNSTRLWLSDS